MKKLIGDPQAVVPEMVDGLVRADDRLARIAGHDVILRADAAAVAAAGRVALISGGGSGHEPAHAGYVGAGMLTAAVLGAVFASPGVDAILAAIRAVTGPAGALLIVKNYTGDRLNFGLAAAMARAEGLAVEMVLVDDDAALPGASRVGRRGLAGTVLVHKIAGAAADEGLSLAAVKAVAERVIAGLATMGVGLAACTVPGAARAGFTLTDDEIEFGLGIHGEAGVGRAPIAPVAAIVDWLVDGILAVREARPGGPPLALMVNGLGATPAMELALVTRSALATLRTRGLPVARVATGTFLSALDMAGCSITLLPVAEDDLRRLDAPTAAPAWGVPTRPAGDPAVIAIAADRVAAAERGPRLDPAAASAFRHAIGAAIDALIAAEESLTELDQAVGDGDLGTSLARGARAVRDGLAALPVARPATALERIAAIVRTSVGGTSGPLSTALLLAMAGALADRTGPPTAVDWGHALAAGCAAVMDIGGARPGDRTMLDGLLPGANALIAGGDAASAADAADAGADATRGAVAAVGRSSYLGTRVVGHPDPGAVAAGIVLRAIARRAGA